MKWILSLLLWIPIFVQSQPIVGDWQGDLEVMGTRLPIVFHVVSTCQNFQATMDSPSQAAFGIKMDTIIVSNHQIRIEASALGMTYSGSLEQDTISGDFSQSGMTFPLVLTRSTSKEPVRKLRPQEPTDIGYLQEEVTILNEADQVTLKGTLTMPNGKYDHVVILISGSGPQNRDSELAIFNHKPFLVWSDWLTKNNIAVLRYDERGVGESTGNYASANSNDLASDVIAILQFVKTYPSLKGKKLGLIGHSEGGMVAPMVYANAPKLVDFLVLLAGPGEPIIDLLLQQEKDILVMQGVAQNEIDKHLNRKTSLYKYCVNNPTMPTSVLIDSLKTINRTQLSQFSDSKRNELLQVEDIELGQLTSNWFRYFLAYRPYDNLSKVTCPILAINGSLDIQVKAEPNLNSIESALKTAGNKHYAIKNIQGMNHLFQQAKTGAVDEYGQIEETVNQQVLEMVSEWIKTR